MGPPLSAVEGSCQVPRSRDEHLELTHHQRLPYDFDLNHPEKCAYDLLQHFRPDLQQRLSEDFLVVKEVSGGITNKLLVAYFEKDEKDKILFRVYGAETDNFIDRAAELKTMVTLHKNKRSGKLYGAFRNGMCYEYVAGVPLTLERLRGPKISRLVIGELVKLHCVYQVADADEVPVVDLFGKMESMCRQMPKHFPDPELQRGFTESFPNHEWFVEEIKYLQKRLPMEDSPVVFCHNDLLHGNILYDEESDRVRFIDFEYAGLSYQAFDLANHFNELAGLEDCDYRRFPSKEAQLEMLRNYLEFWQQQTKMNRSSSGADLERCPETVISADEVELLYVLVNKFTLASHLFWILWTFLQAQNSTIDFDYLKYGKLRFDEYMSRKKEWLEN